MKKFIFVACIIAAISLTGCNIIKEDNDINTASITENGIITSIAETTKTKLETTVTAEVTTTKAIIETTNITTSIATPAIATTTVPVAKAATTTAKITSATPITTAKAPVATTAKVTTAAPIVTTKKTADTQIQSDYISEVLRLVNEERSAYGIAPLSLNSSICSAADVRAKEIVTEFSHTRPNGSSCFTALSDANVSYKTCGENIAAGQKTPEQVVDAWMNSEGHRKNILNSSFNKIGIGYYNNDNTSYSSYWVQLFTD